MTTLLAFLLTLDLTDVSPDLVRDPSLFQGRFLLADGRIEAVEGNPASLMERQSKGDVRDIWYWSSTEAPRKVAADRFRPAIFADGGGRRLEVLVTRSDKAEDESRDDDAQVVAAPTLVVAAPTAMWRDVPEDLLPSWPVPDEGRLELPYDPDEPWRLRVVQSDRGSGWTDLSRDQTVVALPLAAGGADVNFDVVDGEGKPLPEATLHVYEVSPQGLQGDHLARYRADQGRVTIPGLLENIPIAAILTAPERLAVSLFGRPDTLPKRVHLNVGVAVTGRFVDFDGQAVAGVEVELETWVSDGSPVTMRLKSTSDKAGLWRFSPVPARQIVLRASAEGFATRHAKPLVGAGGLDLGDIVLAPATRLHLLVSDERGDPVDQAKIQTAWGDTVTTDAAGRAELQSVSAESSVKLSANARGFLATEVRLTPPHPAVAEISLTRALLVTGRLLDSDEIPVTEGVARLSWQRYQRSELLSSQGNFELELAAHTAFKLILNSPMTRQLHLPIEPGEPGEVRDLGDLMAPGGLQVTAELTSAADGSPVAGARVWVPRASAGNPLTAWVHGDLLETLSDASGVFLLAGLDPSPARIRVDAPGFARRELDLPADATDGSAIGHDIVDLGTVELDGGVTLRVVTEPASEGIARVDLGNRWLEVEMLTAPLTHGRATFAHVAPGEVTVSVLHDKSVVCEELVLVSTEESEIEVPCRAVSLHVSGVVRLGGYPAGPGRLLWLPPATDSPSFIMTEVSSSGLEQNQLYGVGRTQVDVEVGADGYFVTDQLRPGPWEVVWLSKDASTSPARAIELPEVDELEMDLDFPARHVEGMVSDLESKPVEGARVRELATGSIAFTDAGGQFRLSGLEPGVHYLKATTGELTSTPLAVEILPDRDPAPVELVLGDDEPRAVSVRVIDNELGSPVGGAIVFFEAEGRLQQILTADAGGTLELRLDPPYPPRVRLAAFAGGRWALGDWTSWDASLHDEGVVLHLGTTGWLRLSNPTEAAVAPRIISAQGWDLSWLLTRLGLRPIVGPGQTLDLSGFPEADYSISVGAGSSGGAGSATPITIEQGRAAEVELGDNG